MKNRRIAVFLAVFVIIFGLFIYFVFFIANPISGDTRVWGAFSAYINPFITLANLIIFIWFSNQVYIYNSNKDKQDAFFKSAIEKPILIFTNPGVENEVWEVKNIGKGAAFNLKIFYTIFRKAPWVIPITKCYSLGNGGTEKLDWVNIANIIGVLYEDVFSKKYISICADDEMHIRELDDYKTITIEGRIFEKAEFIELEKGPSQRIAMARVTSKISTTSTTTIQTTNPNG